MKTIKRAVSPKIKFLNYMALPVILLIAAFGLFIGGQNVPFDTTSNEYNPIGGGGTEKPIPTLPASVVHNGDIGGSQSVPRPIRNAVITDVNPIGGQKPPIGEYHCCYRTKTSGDIQHSGKQILLPSVATKLAIGGNQNAPQTLPLTDVRHTEMAKQNTEITIGGDNQSKPKELNPLGYTLETEIGGQGNQPPPKSLPIGYIRHSVLGDPDNQGPSRISYLLELAIDPPIGGQKPPREIPIGGGQSVPREIFVWTYAQYLI